MNDDSKSIFFLTLSFICIWLILDNIYGKKYIDNFLNSVFPFYKSDLETEFSKAKESDSNAHLSDSGRIHGGNGGGF